MTKQPLHPADEDTKLFLQEKLLVDVAALIYKRMKETGVNRKQLADLLQVSKGRVTQYLGGERNLTLRTLSDIFAALGSKLHFSESDLAEIPDEAWEPLRLVCLPERAERKKLPKYNRPYALAK